MDYTFTVYPHKFESKEENETYGVHHTKTWEEWCEVFSEHDIREDKEGPCIVLGPMNGKRLKANITEAHATLVDIEKTDMDKIRAAFGGLSAFEYYAWTTHSSLEVEEDWRFRIIIPFVKPIPAIKYEAVWHAVNRLIGGINDKQVKDISRLGYLPSCPASREGQNWAERHEGKLLDPEADLVLPTPAEIRALSPSEGKGTDMEKLRRQLKRLSSDNTYKPLFRLVMEGRPFAEEGHRHQTILDLTWHLASKNREMSHDNLNDLFGPAIDAMTCLDPSFNGMQEIFTAYDGAVAKLPQFEKQRRQEAIQEVRDSALEEQRRIKGVEPYTNEDMLDIVTSQGWGPNAEVGTKWIIQKGTSFWLLCHGKGYVGPFDMHGVNKGIRDWLAPSPVRYMEETDKGRRLLSINEITMEFGEVALKVSADLTKQYTVYDPNEHELRVAVTPLRNLPAVELPRLDAFLRVLLNYATIPHQYEKFLDWCAVLPDPSKPLCALYMIGKAGSGKGMLSTGLSRLWSMHGPSDLAAAISGFNSPIKKCPLLLGDEELPKKIGRGSSHISIISALKQLITSKDIELNEKYKEPMPVHGYPRVLLTANNSDMITLPGEANADDLKAVEDRFMLMTLNPEAVEYLSNVSEEEQTRWADEGIAQHVLWLHQNRKVEKGKKRFYVQGESKDITRQIIASSEWLSLVTECLALHLHTQGAPVKPHHIMQRDGELYTTVHGIVENFKIYMDGRTRKEAESGPISRAFGIIAETKPTQLRGPDGKRRRYHRVNMEYIFDAADRLMLDREAIIETLNKNTRQEKQKVTKVGVDEDERDSG